MKLGGSRIRTALKELYPLAQGGTAVGTGLNTKPQFAKLIAKRIAKLGPGDWFGEAGILDHKARNASVRAATACELLVVRKRDESYALLADLLGQHVAQLLQRDQDERAKAATQFTRWRNGTISLVEGAAVLTAKDSATLTRRTERPARNDADG